MRAMLTRWVPQNEKTLKPSFEVRGSLSLKRPLAVRQPPQLKPAKLHAFYPQIAVSYVMI
jgi:hypothetical protein